MTRSGYTDVCSPEAVRGRSIDEDIESILERLRHLVGILKNVAELLLEGAFAVLDAVTDAIGGTIISLCESLLRLQTNPIVAAIRQTFADRSLVSALPVVFVLHIVILIYTVFVVVYAPAMGLGVLDLQFLVYNALTALAIISYSRAVLTDPGKVPRDESWSKKESPPQPGLRWCSREKLWKPTRTHYCSALSRNVLKMDHYCPWLANCVGYFNHKFFYLFTLYSTILTDWTAVSTISLLSSSSAFLSPSHIFLLSHGSVLSSVLGLVLTPFCAFHTYLLLNNATTLEFCEGRDMGKFSSKGGVMGNLQQALGSNPLVWLLPIHSESSTGLDEGRLHSATSNLPQDQADEACTEQHRNIFPSCTNDERPWYSRVACEWDFMCGKFVRILSGSSRPRSNQRSITKSDIRGFLDPS